MTAFVYMAAAGVATWLLRVLFIDVVPAGKLPERLRIALSDAGPAAMAALIAAEFDHVTLSESAAVIPWVTGLASAILVAMRTRNLGFIVIAGTLAYWGATLVA